MTVIKKSCLTGMVVWIYQGNSRNAARMAYYKACLKEVERVRSWKRTQARGLRAVADLLDAVSASLADPTPEQAAAIGRLRAAAKAVPDCHREFYDHIMEERRRRRRDREIRRRMRERGD